MKRTALSLVGGALAVAAVVLVGRSMIESRAGAAHRADSVWYHESDAARLGTTGRPQLVEFFHPG